MAGIEDMGNIGKGKIINMPKILMCCDNINEKNFQQS